MSYIILISNSYQTDPPTLPHTHLDPPRSPTTHEVISHHDLNDMLSRHYHFFQLKMRRILLKLLDSYITMNCKNISNIVKRNINVGREICS